MQAAPAVQWTAGAPCTEEMYGRRFPQYLSAPFQVLWFESDELAIIFIALIAALLFSNIFTWAAVFVVPFVYSRIKKRYPRGFLKHLFYFIGLSRLEGYPISFETEFYE